MFEQTGSTAVGVEALVARAGFTRGAFYSSFRTVDEVYFAVFDRLTEQVLGVLSRSLESALGGADQSVDAVVDDVVRALPSRLTWYSLRAVLLARAMHDPEANAQLREHTAAFFAALADVLLPALAEVGLAPAVETDLFVQSVATAHLGAVTQSAILDDADAVRVVTVRGVILGLTQPVATHRDPARRSADR